LQRLGELATVRMLMGRALELDEAWERGAIHEAMIALDGMSRLLGGSATRARRHFERAEALSEGQSAFAYVTMASSVAVRRRTAASSIGCFAPRSPSMSRGTRRSGMPISSRRPARVSCCHR
jgi:TRAP transporter TatT component family protein